MEIQKAIKQSSFKSEKEKAIINLYYTANFVVNIHSKIFRKYNILRQHFNILRIINGRKGKPITHTEINEVVMDKGSDVARLLTKLVDLGYITRVKNEHNKREKLIFLTEKGQTTLDNMTREMDESIANDFGLEEKEAAEFSNLLDKLRTPAQEMELV